MNNKIRSVTISYWYKELDSNPIIDIEKLENSLNTMFVRPFLVNDIDIGSNISIPRIQAINSDKTLLFTMSLVNCNILINFVNDLNDDEVILMINENVQLFYDLLKEIYDIKIVYTSIKVDMVTVMDSPCDYFINGLGLKDDNYVDFSFKKVIGKDDTYYINYLVNTGKEINFNIEYNGNKPSESDLFDRSMLISLLDAKVTRETLGIVVEINDRLAFNLNNNYLSTKENIRGMIGELKSVLKF